MKKNITPNINDLQESIKYIKQEIRELKEESFKFKTKLVELELMNFMPNEIIKTNEENEENNKYHYSVGEFINFLSRINYHK